MDKDIEWEVANNKRRVLTLPCVGHDKEMVKDDKFRPDTNIEKLGLKYDNGKIRFDLYPVKAYEGCAKVLTFGANKYTPDGWRHVTDAKNRYYSALIRHLNAQKEYLDEGGQGLALDEESGLPHLDHAQCCLVFLRELS